MRLLPALAFAACLTASPAFAQHDHHAPPAPDPHAGHDMPAQDTGTAKTDPPEPVPEQEAVIFVHGMSSPLGPYFISRDGSGTSWIPETHFRPMLHNGSGDWTFMGHAALNAVHVNQGGPRGGQKTFVSGMVGGMAVHGLGPGEVQFRAMLSPDPFMGKSGYPLLLAAGETADGAETLVDRQHPHDLFMELAASYSLDLGVATGVGVFLYGGLPGEPAFGPPAFMHRPSGMDSPEAPISHHWLDSTHVTFGVVTAGLVWTRFKLDASAFRGREPDEERFDIETGDLDSRAIRLTYNPGRWSLQASWASIESPEALEPDHDERRFSASVMHGLFFGNSFLAVTAAWARKDKVPGEVLDAMLLEASLEHGDDWTFFGRAEQVEQDELGVHHGPAYTVRKASVGAIRDFPIAEHVKVGVGALISVFDIEEPLSATYDDPISGMAFVRMKIG